MTTKRVYLHYHAFAYAYRHSQDQAQAEAYAEWSLKTDPDGRRSHIDAYYDWLANHQPVDTILGVPITMVELRGISADGP